MLFFLGRFAPAPLFSPFSLRPHPTQKSIPNNTPLPPPPQRNHSLQPHHHPLPARAAETPRRGGGGGWGGGGGGWGAERGEGGSGDVYYVFVFWFCSGKASPTLLRF